MPESYRRLSVEIRGKPLSPPPRSKLVTYSAEVPVLHTPVEVAEVRFSMTCSVVDGQGKRANIHIPAIMSAAFPDVVVFDGFI